MTESEQALAALIESCQPRTIAAFGDTGQRLAEHWQAQHSDCQLTHLAPSDTTQGLSLPETQDLALVTDALEELSRAQGQTLIGQLRNYGTRQIAVLVDNQSGWTLSDFIGLGFKRQARLEEGSKKLTLYTYNINNYNHKRTWNNPKYWANPEMWDKARW
ncbi:DUF6231 family protein [Marinimicrobium agarilyticum]|uniref:DUF6231 family protein n=1 Tax=Marinimicrobium agarilyticum TaxID=306546 RepID=UPI000405AB35|nr:DUF6231 family protein [Marinimicrobium agarilyticum]